LRNIAAALLRTPELLVLDEPTSSLDPAGARDVRALVRRLAENGAAVVWSSHDMSEVEELCTELTVIDRGRRLFSGTVGALRKLASAAVHVLRTSDDRTALLLARGHADLEVKALAPPDDGLEIWGDVDALDEYVIALGRARVAVRALEKRIRSLESLFLELTSRQSIRRADAIEPSITPAQRVDDARRTVFR